MSLSDSLEVVARAQNGDPQALGALYDEHHEGVFRFLWARVGDRQVAEDLAGDVFLRMLHSLAQFQPRGIPFRAWLYGIARHLLVDYYRSQHRHATTSLEAMPPVADEEPWAAAEQHLTLEGVMRVLARLDPLHQEVIALRFINGLSLRETAQALNKSEGAVKAMQHRAILALRAALVHKTG